jgi:hypothetical protein
MNSPALLLGPATLCGALLISGALAEPAVAQGVACKSDAVTAAGRAKFRPFSKTKELEGRGAAMADAVAKWQQEVGTRFGEPWRTWSNAKDTRVECAPTKEGKIGSSFIGCTISGRPCSLAAAPKGKATADRDKRDREGRARDEEGQSGRREGPKGPNDDYEREMARQERMAAERRKAEQEAYEKEMAYQRLLQEKRAKEREKEEQYERARSPNW